MRVKGVIDAIANATKQTWSKPKPASPKAHKRIVPNARELELPILLTNFKKWSDTPHPPVNPIARTKSTMPGLDTNIFGQMLASSARMDKLTRAVLPADLLIKLGYVENKPGSKLSRLFTPLWTGDVVQGPKGYMTLNTRAIQVMSKKHRMIQNILLAGKTKESSSVGDWNAVDYSQMILQEIEDLMGKLKARECATPSYKLSFKADVSVKVELSPSEDTIAQFNVAKLINEPVAVKWAKLR